MAVSYPGTKSISVASKSNVVNTNAPKINDIRSEFRKLNDQANYISLHSNDQKFSSIYSANLEKTHFQGIVRLKNSNYFLISGGDKVSQFGNLFLYQFNSYKENRTSFFNKTSAVGSNLILSKEAPLIDELKEIFLISEGSHWHAGGLCCLGDLVVVPLEDAEADTAFINFYDFSDPLQPKELKHVNFKRTSQLGKTGAVGIIRLPNDHFLCITWKDVVGGGRFDLYYSKSTDLNDGFSNTSNPIQVHFSSFNFPKNRLIPQYQSIQLWVQNDNRVFVSGVDGLGIGPITEGLAMNVLQLYEVHLDISLEESTSKLKGATIEYVGSKNFTRTAKQYNFDAGASAYIDSKSNLLLYSVAHWLNKSKLGLAEFVQISESHAITHIDNSIIELYEHEDFKGRCLRIYGKTHSKIKNYQKVRVQGKSFGDKVSSLRYIIPTGEKYLFFKDKNFDKKVLTLEGTGKWEQINDLSTHSANDCISSSKYK